MPRDKIILACNDCKNRNYFTTKNKRVHPERVEWKKYCPRCNKHVVHKETKYVASEVVVAESAPKRLVNFFNEVVVEMKKVTWPDRPQVVQLSIGVIVISLGIGLVIWVLDLILQGVLVRGIPSLFGA